MADATVFADSGKIKTKTCTRCRIEKSLESFPLATRNRDGRGFWCKDCVSENRKPGIRKQIKERRIIAQLLAALGIKRCTKCALVRPIPEFNVNRLSPDGRAWKCKTCSRARSKEFRKLHPGAFQKWAITQKDRLYRANREWREKNKRRVQKSYAEWSKRNRHKINAQQAKRTAARKSAVPKWANRESIRAIYEEAARLRRSTGQPYEVDHIVPLQSNIVCGLHWEGNLRIVLKFENISKLNRRWPGMPINK